jgi:hypothetical protein
MTYVYLLVLGVVCAGIANETRHNVKSWYIAGTLLGGLALIALIGINFHKHMPVVRS